ncbi:MAG: family 43 glycosylhydrolase [Clostridiales bacterium]|nr:family 43 glycosylhydrolase [Clostridiales bacterium]
MKLTKKIVALGLAILLALGTVVSCLPTSSVAAASTDSSTSTNLIDSLTGHYTFDNTLANSASSSGGAASLHGGAGDTWNSAVTGTANYSEDGVSGSAYEFLGNSDDVSGEGLELDIKTAEEFTISLWVNTYQKVNYQPIFLAINDGYNYVTAGTYYNNYASGGIANYSGRDWYWLDQNNNSSSTLKDLPTETWTYVTLTMTSDGVATLYYNGEVLSTQTIEEYDSSVYTSMPIYLGINWWDTSYCGLMDEVLVYSSALTEEEVYTLYTCDGDPEAAAEAEQSGDLSTAVSHVSVHDPSIVKGYVADSVTTVDSTTDIIGEADEDHTKAIYFIFGSHLAFAYSWDLVDWTYYTNNITTDYETLFEEEAEWSAKGSSTYDLSGNMWAPDVIWVEDYDNGDDTTGAWCMYMSINGDNWYSTICLLTSSSLSGDWTHQGMVIQSGNYAYESTGATFDYYTATGETEDSNNLSRYTANRNGNLTYEDNCIDPCVTYDESGNLWMTYGSWFGGIWMIKLDGTTGLRDYTTTYKYEENVSDPYQGYKLAQGDHSSGEASYIEYINGYYYLFVTYGGLTATGGYNMRVYRSASITGPYVDESDDTANYSAYQNNVNSTLGMRLMSYYKWSYQTYAQVAQGHNSVYYDKDTDQIYLVYHTRTNDGSEGHTVRVHQLFVNEDGWLVTAPFEYTGETTTNEDITTTSYSTDDIVGMYEVLLQAQSIDYANLAYVEPIYIALGSDGSISGDLTGTWSTTDGTCYITLTTGTDTYNGVLLTQTIEGKTKKTITFTGVGVNTETAIWGYQFSGTEALEMEAEALSLPAQTVNGTSLDLYTDGIYGTTIEWSSSDTSIIATDGTVTVPATTTDVTLTAKISNDDGSYSAEYVVTVLGEDATDEDGNITVWTSDATYDLTDAVHGTYSFVNYFNSESGTAGLTLYNGASIEFTVKQTGNYAYLSNILGINTGTTGGLYFTGGSYLGYNATGGYFDANVYSGYGSSTDWYAGTDYISNNGDVTFRIEIYSYKYEVYVNDVLAYSNSTVDEGDTLGNNNIDTYYSILSYLNSTATEFDLGWGSWWDGGFAGTISDITLKALGAEATDTSGYVYYEDFQSLAGQTGSGTNFTSANASSNLNVVADDYVDWYLEFANNGAGGNRGAYALFDEAVQKLTTYTVEVDTALTAGVMAQRSISEFVILGTDSSSYTGNNAITSGYILKLHNEPPSTTAAGTSDYSLQTTWYINDTDETVTIPVGTWVHIQADVDVEEGIAEITITNRETEEVLYTGTVDVNGDGVLGGLYLLTGRGVGKTLVDNISVTCIHSWVETNRVEATCTEDGEIEYTCTQCGGTYTESIDALGHDWDYTDLTWNWASDYSSATVTYSCTRNSSHTDTVDAEVEYEVITAATCEEAGSGQYTASVTLDGTEYEATATVEISPLGHSYGEPAFVWDTSTTVPSVEVVVSCVRTDCGAYLSETLKEANLNSSTATTMDNGASVAYTSETASDGSTVYTVTYTVDGVKYTSSTTIMASDDDDVRFIVEDEEEVSSAASSAIEAVVTSTLSSNATTSYYSPTIQVYDSTTGLWSTATDAELAASGGATLTLAYPDETNSAYTFLVTAYYADGTTEVLTATLTSSGIQVNLAANVATLAVSYVCDHDYVGTVTTAATCEGEGLMTYVCSICGNTYTEVIAATGHSWDYANGTWTWASDYSSATLTATCSNDSTHTTTVDAVVTSVDSDGSRTYTATVTVDGVSYTKSVDVAITDTETENTETEDTETEDTETEDTETEDTETEDIETEDTETEESETEDKETEDNETQSIETEAKENEEPGEVDSGSTVSANKAKTSATSLPLEMLLVAMMGCCVIVGVSKNRRKADR